jgi:O-antigen ligase
MQSKTLKQIDNTSLENANNTLAHSVQLKNGIWPLSLPLYMAGFYIALFIIRPWEVLIPWLMDIHFERVYGILMILVVLFSRKKHLNMTFQLVTVLIFLGGICLSAFFAITPSLSWDLIYKYLTLIIFFFILTMVIRNPYELTFIITCYIATMAIYLAKAQWEYFIHGAGQYRMGVWRLAGIETTLGDPNSLAASIILSLPFLLFLWTSRKKFSFAWPPLYKKLFPFFLIIYSILAVSSLILTNSRTGMLSFILFVVIVSFSWYKGIAKKLGYIFLSILLLLTLWSILPFEQKNRFESIWNPEKGPISAHTSAQGRVEGFKAGMTMFKRFPLTGIGPDNFIKYRVSHVDGIPLNAHSLYGQILGEIGLVGVFPFSLMVFVMFVNIRKVRVITRIKSDPNLNVLSNFILACHSSLILLLFLGLFGHNLYRFNWLWIAAFSSLALIFAKQRLQDLEAD